MSIKSGSFFLTLLLISLPAISEQQEDRKTAVKITQGIEGRIEFFEGDFMPRLVLPGQKDSPRGTITYPKRQVFVFEKTKADSRLHTFWTKINSKLVASMESDKNGYFSIQLPEGEYSIVVLENGKYHAESFDEDGNIFPVRVRKNEVTLVIFKIMYKSTH